MIQYSLQSLATCKSDYHHANRGASILLFLYKNEKEIKEFGNYNRNLVMETM